MPGIKKVSIRETKIMLPDAEAGEGFRNENTWVLDVSSPLLWHATAYCCSALGQAEVWRCHVSAHYFNVWKCELGFAKG